MRAFSYCCWLADRAGQPEPKPGQQGFDRELSGETVLPGFRLRLAELR